MSLLDDACRHNIGNDGTEADDAVALIGVDGIDEQYHAGIRNGVNDNTCTGEAGVAISLLGKQVAFVAGICRIAIPTQCAPELLERCAWL